MRLREARWPLRGFALWHGVAWGLVGVVLYLSLMPQPPQLDISSGDKLGHLAGYALLMVWFTQLYARPAHWRLGVALFALGVFIECVQGLTAHRSFEWLDMAADGGGVLLGWWLGGTVFASVLQRVAGLQTTRR